MADYNVSITITGNDQASDDLRSVSGQLERVEGSTKRTGENAQGATDPVSGFGNALSTAITLALVERAAGLATELYNIGENARTARNVFDTLNGSTEVSNETMDRLRERTRGAASVPSAPVPVAQAGTR